MKAEDGSCRAWDDMPASLSLFLRIRVAQVYFDVEIDGKPAGRVVMGLFGKVRWPFQLFTILMWIAML